MRFSLIMTTGAKTQTIRCMEIWGGTGASDISVKLAGVRGEVYAAPYGGDSHGGDIHFLSVCGQSILSKIVLADVSGHGAEVAAVSEIIHEALLRNIDAHDNSSMLQAVNAAMIQSDLHKDRFTTMAALIFDSRDRSLVYAYAGHPSILRGRAGTGRFRRIHAEDRTFSGPPLGVLPTLTYNQHRVVLDPGDVLVVYTDAFSEHKGPDGRRLEERGLIQLLEEAGSMQPAELKEYVLERTRDVQDDASLVVLEVL